ncbi:hypothetical protein CB452P1_000074 [Clostridium phage CB452P1]|nr:hypothetical protein CB452P1_000074 [Clostridium phage CB452P1]
MKVKELIKELQKYDEELEVKIYKKPKISKQIKSYSIKNVGKHIKAETKEIINVNIAY